MKKLWRIIPKREDSVYESCAVIAENADEAWKKTDGVMCYSRKHYIIEEVKEEFIYYIE